MTAKPRIVAALCWYDEAPEMLTRCVASLEGFADAIVTSDGPYKHYPAIDNESSIRQHAAIASAARAAMIPQSVLVPPADPVTQTEKRTRLYRAAAAIAGDNGWVLIIDADEALSGDTKQAIARLRVLADTTDCASVMIRTGSTCAPQPRLLRALPALTCGPEYHGMLSATDTTGKRVCIRDRREIIMRENPRPRRARELKLDDILTLDNDTENRPSERIEAKRGYINNRMREGVDL